ncbi:hypothetical protein Tco_1528616 [Tanacetum coccineum]
MKTHHVTKRKEERCKTKRNPKSPSLARSRSVFSRLGSEEGERKERRRRSPSQASSRSASVVSRLGAKRQEQRRKDTRELIRSYVTFSSKCQRENKKDYRRHEREDSRDEPLESEDSAGERHCKRQSRRARKEERDDLSEPYDEESTTHFTQRINKFAFPKIIRMPTTVKTYDGMGDPKDHLKTFITAAKVERWAMPT